MIPFSKYSAAGNDFILLDNRQKEFDYSYAPLLCHRQEGIGADGVILWEEGERGEFTLRVFNSDGSEAEMCGNGLRAFVKFLKEKGVDRSTYQIENREGKLYKASFSANEWVKVEMAPPSGIQSLVLDNHLLYFVNTGVPHLVLFSEDVEKAEVERGGRYFRNHPFFAPSGTNVNFVTLKKKHLRLRTYERGVERETLACGTGSVAAALVAASIHQLPSPIQVEVRSKAHLVIHFQKEGDLFTQVTMEGPAKKVFEGVFSPPF